MNRADTRINYINTWPEGLTEEPRDYLRAATCRTCGGEFITQANDGPLPERCLTCVRKFDAIRRKRRRMTVKGAAESDLPALPEALPTDVPGDGAWLLRQRAEVRPLDIENEDAEDDESLSIEEYRPRRVNALGLDMPAPSVEGVTGRAIGSHEVTVEHDRLRLARMEVCGLVARGRRAVAEVRRRDCVERRWLAVDALYDIATQEGVRPPYKGLRIAGAVLWLRWDEAARLMLDESQAEFNAAGMTLVTHSPGRAYVGVVHRRGLPFIEVSQGSL